MLSLSVGVRANLSTEIRRFGANIVLYPQADDGLLDDSVGPRVEKGALGSRIYASAPFLHQPAVVSGKPFDLVGTDFADALKVSPYWRVTGSAPTKGQVAVGADVAAALKLEPGSSIDVRIAKPTSSGKGSGACRSCHGSLGAEHDRRTSGRLAQVGSNCLSCHQAHPIATSTGYVATVSAIVSTGGDEDGWVIAPLTDVQSLSKSGNRISYLRVSALTDSEPAEKTAARLSGLIDGVRPEVVGSVASAEDNLLGKVQLLLALLTACVAGMSALGLFSMLGASVLERTGEIGLVKAIGASNGSVSRQIVAEAAVLAVAGAALGLLAGAGIVRLIGNSVFGASMSLTIGAVPVAVASCLLLAISASLAAARRAARIDPAICLRGE